MTATEALAPPARYVTEIPLDELHAVDHNRDLGDLEGMAATMRVLGVLEPVLVRSTEGAGYEIIAGARRTAAARIAGLPTVPCLIENDRDDQEVELARAIENLQRKDLTPIEEAQVFERLSQPPFSLTMEAIGESVGRTKSHISKRRSLLLLPQPARAALEDHRINIQTALGMTSLTRDRERLDRIVDAIPDEDATEVQLERQRQELDRKLAEELREHEAQRRRATKLAELEEADETIIDYPRFGQWSQTDYRKCQPGEAHEAVAVDHDGNVVKVTTQASAERNRQVPKPPPGADPGFVEQARRKKQAELDAVAERRVAVARNLLDTAGLDDELTEYVLTGVVRSLLELDPIIDYVRPEHVRTLLELDENVPLVDYAQRTALTRLRAAAACHMAIAEFGELRNVHRRPKAGEWAPVDDGDQDDYAAERRYLELLERHGYEPSDEERAAISPAPNGENNE